jgi:hypothetical protein
LLRLTPGWMPKATGSKVDCFGFLRSESDHLVFRDVTGREGADTGAAAGVSYIGIELARPFRV